MRTRYMAASVLAALLAALAAPGDGASPGLYGGIGYVDADELAREIERREHDMLRAEKREEEIETRISRLVPQIEIAEKERKQQALKARRSIILHDRMARGGWLRMAFSSTSLSELAVFGHLYARMLEREGEALSALRRKEEILRAKRKALEDDRDVLDRLRADLMTHKKDLETKRETLLSLRSAPFSYR